MLDRRFLEAGEQGIRLEMGRGLPIWEAHPVGSERYCISPSLIQQCRSFMLVTTARNIFFPRSKSISFSAAAGTV